MNLCTYVRVCSALRICLQDLNVLFREHFLSRSVPKFQNARVTRVLSPRHLETSGRDASAEIWSHAQGRRMGERDFEDNFCSYQLELDDDTKEQYNLQL